MRGVQKPLRVVLLKLRIVIDRSRAAGQSASSIGKLQVARVDCLLVVDLPCEIAAKIRLVLLILIRAIRIAIRSRDLVDRICNILLLLRIGRVRSISGAITRTDDSSPNGGQPRGKGLNIFLSSEGQGRPQIGL